MKNLLYVCSLALLLASCGDSGSGGGPTPGTGGGQDVKPVAGALQCLKHSAREAGLDPASHDLVEVAHFAARESQKCGAGLPEVRAWIKEIE